MSGPLALVYPVMAQLLLTFMMMLWMGRVRVQALRAGRVRVADVSLSRTGGWPDDVAKIANNAHNQFETPILFFVLCGAAIYVNATGAVMTLLAWAYVGSRIVHTAIHVTSNQIRHRFAAFALGLIVLMVMWLVLAARLLAGG